MSVSLLKAAKEEASKYISPKDFLCYMSYKLGRPIGEVASFLLYSYFDEEVCEYYIDQHYRIYPYNDISCDYKTSKLLEEITKDGFFDYLMFCNSFFDDCSSINSDSDFYTPIRIDFYYSIDALEELKFIKELNLDLKNASALDYTVYSDDTVKAEKPKDERAFKLISLRSHVTVENITPSIKEYGDQFSKVDIFEAIITDKIPAPTVTQTEPPNNSQLIKELAAAKAQITDLENQLAQAKAALADKPADEVELNPKTRTSATRIMNVLFHKAQLDITAHQGTTNKTIVNLSKSLNAKITEKPVIFWIKEVQQLRIDTEKDN